MDIHSPTLFIEINNSEYIFSVQDENSYENLNLIYKCIVPIESKEKKKKINFDLAFDVIKNNVYIIEQKLNFTFKEVILIINNFESSFINLTGFKKLNRSQILKENITYILNSLKSCIDETEENKTILHIFNSKYSLDKTKIENLPIGLFGDFYSHELSFNLINKNDYKNLKNVFNNCNLKIRKILLKSFVEGSLISDQNSNLNTFFQITINKNDSHIFYFENDSLKFEQNFDFGSDLVIQDISKITSLKIETIKKILNSNKLYKEISNDILVEEELFNNENYLKVKKRLISNIAAARIQELSEVILKKNINLSSFNKNETIIFLKINDKINFKCFENTYLFFFSKNNDFKVMPGKNFATDDIIKSAYQLAQFGWKKEAIPVTHAKKTIIAKFFDILFN